MFHFFWSPGFRESSRYSELPSITELDDEDLRDWGLVAGGLALVLSRCSSRAVERDFSAASQAYRSVRRQMRRDAAIEVSAQLLNDASHEVAAYADAATRQALARRLQRASPRCQLEPTLGKISDFGRQVDLEQGLALHSVKRDRQ